MGKELFDFFIGILRILAKEDYESNTIENAVVTLIDSFEQKLSQEQKNEILREFVKYERIRKAQHDENYEKRKKAVAEMKYREIAESAVGYHAGEARA